jgi:two-component system chemotaxis response regulator CheB
VLIAPPDAHMLFSDGHVLLSRGPRESHSRPSITKLFRSAAAHFGGRVIAVLLTGMLDDGVAGLLDVRATGGLVVIQDPEDAEFDDLPKRALEAMQPDLLLPVSRIGAQLVELVMQPQPEVASPPPEKLLLEAELDIREHADPATMDGLGRQAAVMCPDCGGPTWHVGDGAVPRYRCYLGHVATGAELLDKAGIETESALWSAVRALNDRAMTFELLAQEAARGGNSTSSDLYAGRGRETRHQADVLRTFLQDLLRPLSRAQG